MALELERANEIVTNLQPIRRNGDLSESKILKFPSIENDPLLDETHCYQQFKAGILWDIPLSIYRHPKLNLFSFGGDKRSVDKKEMEIAGHAILSWDFNGGYMRLASYALEHHPGYGILIPDGIQGNETVLERNVYFNHPDGLTISDDNSVTRYPKEIKNLLAVFDYGYHQKDRGAVDWAKEAAISKGYDFEFYNGIAKVVLQGTAKPNRHSFGRSYF